MVAFSFLILELQPFDDYLQTISSRVRLIVRAIDLPEVLGPGFGSKMKKIYFCDF